MYALSGTPSRFSLCFHGTYATDEAMWKNCSPETPPTVPRPRDECSPAKLYACSKYIRTSSRLPAQEPPDRAHAQTVASSLGASIEVSPTLPDLGRVQHATSDDP